MTGCDSRMYGMVGCGRDEWYGVALDTLVREIGVEIRGVAGVGEAGQTWDM